MNGLVIVMILLQAVAAGNQLFLGMRLATFANDRSAIKKREDLDSLKQVLRVQMVATLCQMALLVTPILLFFIGLFLDVLTRSHVHYLIWPSLFNLGLGIFFKRVETRVQQMPVEESLQKEFVHVIDVWQHKPFADW